MGMLSLQNLRLGYHDTEVVRDLNLDLQDGEFFCLLGPSGGGKSTILKTIAGLLPPLSGEILIDGQRINRLPPEKRDVVLIFQQPLLFPFLSVYQNIGFGLKMHAIPRRKARARIERIMEITDISGLRRRRVHQLSGGQQQRVALARGLVLEPSVLLLDEPLSALDAGLREKMRELLVEIQRQTGTTMLFVTHDQSEAFVLGDRVGLLLGGQLHQVGRPEELFYRPTSPAVARFFGCRNLFSGSIANGLFSCDLFSMETALKNRAQCQATIRPEDIRFSPKEFAIHLSARVERIRFEGSMTRVLLRCGSHHLSAITSRPPFCESQTVDIFLPEKSIHIFPENGEGDEKHHA